MTATKTREFMAEMRVLCTVHHTNLVCFPIHLKLAAIFLNLFSQLFQYILSVTVSSSLFYQGRIDWLCGK